MTKYEKRFLAVPLILAVSYTLAFTLTPGGILMDSSINYVFYAIYGPLGLSAVYWLFKGGDPSKRTWNIPTVSIVALLMAIMLALGLGGGHLVARLSGGLYIKYTADQAFEQTYTCVKSERIKLVGWVNFIKDSRGREFRLDGFKAFCGVGHLKRNTPLRLSGRETGLGRVVEKILVPEHN